VVHAYKDAVRAATLAGCTQVEHGTLATDDDLRLMAQKGTYLDPQAGLVIENYLLNKDRYVGTPGYTEEGFAAMQKILERLQATGMTPQQAQQRLDELGPEAMLADHTMHAAAEPVLRSAAVAGSGHEPLMREIRQLARRARISLTDADAPKPQAGPIGLAKFGLTERELAVLRLLAQGHTNAEIGRMLFISPKTASVHVTNILRKLGAGSRVQAATTAERAGLLDQD